MARGIHFAPSFSGSVASMKTGLIGSDLHGGIFCLGHKEVSSPADRYTLQCMVGPRSVQQLTCSKLILFVFRANCGSREALSDSLLCVRLCHPAPLSFLLLAPKRAPPPALISQPHLRPFGQSCAGFPPRAQSSLRPPFRQRVRVVSLLFADKALHVVTCYLLG